MRKTFLILGLVAITMMAAANDAFAQRFRIGGRRGGVGIDYGPGYSSPYYGGSPYSGDRYSYGPYSGRGYYYPDSYLGPNYYPDAVTQIPADNRQSFYSDPNSATITVRVPNADAQVWFDDKPTAQRGMERMFQTPGLQSGGTYTIKARWMEDGRTIDQQRQVQVQPGRTITVDFHRDQAPPKTPAGEKLPSPVK